MCESVSHHVRNKSIKLKTKPKANGKFLLSTRHQNSKNRQQKKKKNSKNKRVKRKKKRKRIGIRIGDSFVIQREAAEQARHAYRTRKALGPSCLKLLFMIMAERRRRRRRIWAKCVCAFRKKKKINARQKINKTHRPAEEEEDNERARERARERGKK